MVVESTLRYSVRLDGSVVNVSIGFAPPEQFNPDKQMEETCGWYIAATNGQLYSKAGGISYDSKGIGSGSVVTATPPASKSMANRSEWPLATFRKRISSLH